MKSLMQFQGGRLQVVHENTLPRGIPIHSLFQDLASLKDLFFAEENP